MLVAVFLVAAVASQPPASGARLAVTQDLLDNLRDAVLPAAIQFIANFPFPPFEKDYDSFDLKANNVSGCFFFLSCLNREISTDPPFETSRGQIKLSNVDVDAAFSLQSPGTLVASLSNLQLSVSADVSAREDIWPHPSASGSISADADGTSASIAMSVNVADRSADGVPSLAVDSCSADVHVNNLAFHGLGILDPIIDWVGGFFTGWMQDTIKDMICTTGVQQVLSMVNPFLSQLSYVALRLVLLASCSCA